MTNRVLSYGLSALSIITIAFACSAVAQEPDLEANQTELLQRLEQQQTLIARQNQRIERLEQAIKKLIEPTKQSVFLKNSCPFIGFEKSEIFEPKIFFSSFD